jgi:hypothetical protein
LKIFLAISIFVLFTLSAFISRRYASSNPQNYLSYKSINLNNHLISNYKTEKKTALILGSSSAAGSNLIRNSTLADFLNNYNLDYYFYNLGSLEGTLIDSMIFLDQAVQIKKPDLVLIGLNPGMFELNYGSFVPIANIEILKKFLTSKEIAEIKSAKNKKLYTKQTIDFVATTTIPYPYILNLKEYFSNLSILTFGSIYNNSVERQEPKNLDFLKNPNWLLNLKSILNYCKEKEIPVFLYLEPILKFEEYYRKDDWDIFEKQLTYFIKENKTKDYNFVRSIPNDAEHFIDYQHLTPSGYKFLANKIEAKIREKTQ